MSKILKETAKSASRINVALFGFSRGAALARAFARRLANLSEQKGDDWRLKGNGRPIELYFMGLFDTVASVGLAASANNGGALGQLSTRAAVASRYTPSASNDSAPFFLALGPQPGANPTAGLSNGHGAWADDLRITPMVQQCVHMVAAHEIRNSFPLDSALEGRNYPKNCVELVFPGAHSDVGGGYREGEGARGLSPGEMLSLLPLQRMREIAILSGVPLRTAPDKDLMKDFGLDSEAMKDFLALSRRFNHYMTSVKNSAGAPLGKQMLAHMKLYYQWRFYKIAYDQRTRKSHNPTLDARRLERFEAGWAAEKAQKTQLMNQLKKEEKEIRDALTSQSFSGMMSGSPPSDENVAAFQEKRRVEMQKHAAYMEAQAVLATMPGTDGSQLKNMNFYDEQLMRDAQLFKLIARVRPLRPHYKALLEAYEDEFEKGKGMRDAELIAFFDNYVHDSLAGFAGDATLPSDPRVIYISGNTTLSYAMNDAPRAPAPRPPTSLG